jgi:hypothetical protein
VSVTPTALSVKATPPTATIGLARFAKIFVTLIQRSMPLAAPISAG